MCTKLVFNDKDHNLGSHAKSNVDSTVDSSSKMIIDDTPLINAATNFCKRKAGDISVDSKSVDKVRVMKNPSGNQLHASSPAEVTEQPRRSQCVSFVSTVRDWVNPMQLLTSVAFCGDYHLKWSFYRRPNAV